MLGSAHFVDVRPTSPAAAVGYANRGTAFRTVAKAMDSHVAEAVEEHRHLEVERLDALQAGLWDRAVAGDLAAAEAALKIIVARCKLLGLNQTSAASQATPRTVVLPPAP